MSISVTKLDKQNCHSGIMQYIDPRIKIICAILWSFFMAIIESIFVGLIGLCLAIILIILARWEIKDLTKRLILINIFTLFMWCIVPFAISSKENPVTEPILAEFGFLAITVQGFNLMVLITIKINTILISIISLLGTSPLYTLAQAGIKLKFSTKLINLFLLTIRYIYVIFDEYLTLSNAMKIRGFKLNLSKNTIIGLANLLGLLLVRSMDRAERIHHAMLCRGYDGTIWIQTDFKLKWYDIFFLIAMLGIMIILGVLLCLNY